MIEHHDRHPDTSAIRQAGAPRRAFTLLELLVVMVIIATVAGIAAPRFAEARSRAGLRAAAARVQSDVAFALEHARRTGSGHTLRFDSATESYRLLLTDQIDDPAVFTTDLSAEPYGADIVSVTIDGSIKGDLAINGHGDVLSSLSVVVERGGRRISLNAGAGDDRVLASGMGGGS